MNLSMPLQGIRYTFDGGWEVFSPLFRFPIRCGAASDARRIAQAIQSKFPDFDGIDYSEVDAAIAKEKALQLFGN